MSILAPDYPRESETRAGTGVVCDQPRLVHDYAGRALEEELGQIILMIHGAVGDGTRTVLGLVVPSEYPAVTAATAFRSGGESTSWIAGAERLFLNSRNMSHEEKAEFDEMTRSLLRPLSKPIKRSSR